jgi:hypothetical protein
MVDVRGADEDTRTASLTRVRWPSRDKGKHVADHDIMDLICVYRGGVVGFVDNFGDAVGAVVRPMQVEESLTINRVVADLLDERSPKACEQAGKFIRIAYTPLIGDDAGFFAGPDASKCGLGEN